MVGKRYGKTPWELIETGPEILEFNVNVAVKAMIAEINASGPKEIPGAMTTRRDVTIVMQRATAEVIEMEEARRKRSNG